MTTGKTTKKKSLDESIAEVENSIVSKNGKEHILKMVKEKLIRDKKKGPKK